MNERFLLLPEEKQNKMINAAYKVFALNDYKKAPMSEIAAEGEISKSLLFYYFDNKLELYMYLWEKTMELTRKSLIDQKVMETTDFFEMLSRSLKAKCSIMRHYPFLYLFSMNAYYEKEEEVKECIQKSFHDISEQGLEKVLNNVNTDNIRDELTIADIYREIIYASDGFLLGFYRAGTIDIDQLEKEYDRMIQFWKKAYGKGEKR